MNFEEIRTSASKNQNLNRFKWSIPKR